jgi:tetratricopeptide (TPR) repeat protein
MIMTRVGPSIMEHQANSLLRTTGRIVSLNICLWLGYACAADAQAPADASDRFRAATQAMREGHLDEAAAGFSAVVGAEPTFAEAHLNLGLVLEEQGRNKEAVMSLQKALKLKPRLRGANLFLGIAEYRLNQFDLAVVSLKKEISYDPSSANAWMWLGVVQLANGKADDAAESLDRAARLDPKNVDILYNRGRAHLLVSKASYEAMYKADADSWHVHQVLAQAYAEADRHAEAIAEYQAAIRKAPNQPGLHEELGSEFLKAEKPEAAETEFQQELDLDPENPFALFKLGATQVERGAPEKGKQSIELALQKNPQLQNADYYLGRAEMQLGHNEQAISALKHATNTDSDPEIVQLAWYQLAIVYRRVRRSEDAKQALATFQRLKDESSERQHQLFEKKREMQSRDSLPPEEANPPI